MSKTIENLKSGNYEVVDNQGVSVTNHFIECLEKELANFIEPKFKYEDYVYAVFTDTDIFKGQIDVFDYYTRRYLVFFGEDIGGEWFGESRLFTTKAEAKAKLKKIKGE